MQQCGSVEQDKEKGDSSDKIGENEEEIERRNSLVDALNLEIPDDNSIYPGQVYVLPPLQQEDDTKVHSSLPIITEARQRTSRLRRILSRLNPFRKI